MDGDDGGKTMRGRGRGRGRGGRGRGVRGARGGRGRGKKAIKVVESDEDETVQQQNQQPQSQQQLQQQPQQQQQAQQNQQQLEIIKNDEGADENQPPPKIDLEADILQLEAPTFTTLNRGPPEPMLRLRWDHRVNLVAEKVLNPMIHCCDKCLKPILIYGRMIPCKHVFCLTCAKREDKVCPRCMNKVARVEQTGLGTVFMCTHDGTRYGSTGCRRTYLSQRDLQAHFNHRHISTVPSLGSGGGGDSSQEQQSPVLIISTGGGMGGNRLKPQPQPSPQHMTSANDPRIPQSIDHHRRNSPPAPPPPQYMPQHRPPHASHQSHPSHPASMYQPQPNPVTGSMRTNLITVQIQDSTTTAMETTPAAPPGYYNQPPPHPPQYAPPPPYPVPPPPPQFYQPGPPPTAYPPPPPGPPLPPPRPPPPPHSFQEPPHSHTYNPPPQWPVQHPSNTTQQFYH